LSRCHRCESTDLELRPERTLAECRACHLVFDPSRPRPQRRPLAASSEANAPGGAIVRRAIEAPPDMSAVELWSGSKQGYRSAEIERPSGVEIAYRWGAAHGDETWRYVAGLVIVGALGVAYWLGWIGRSKSDGDGWFFLALLTIMGVIIATRFAYVGLNSTTINVEGGALVVRHGPLPFPGNREIPLSEIDQLYAEYYVERRKNHEVHAYRVMLIRQGEARHVVLLSGIVAADQAAFIERTVERVAGITDRPVAGELGYRG
jgi:hypothetical protein